MSFKAYWRNFVIIFSWGFCLQLISSVSTFWTSLVVISGLLGVVGTSQIERKISAKILVFARRTLDFFFWVFALGLAGYIGWFSNLETTSVLTAIPALACSIVASLCLSFSTHRQPVESV
jgi:hypothetical protein